MYTVTVHVVAASLMSNVLLFTLGLDVRGTLTAVQGWNKHLHQQKAGIIEVGQLIDVDMYQH